MPKRFTDTEKWKKPFIRSLEAPYKLLWFYILDDCNHAGIWEVDIEVAEIRIGEKLSVLYALEKFGSRVQKISETKWFIPDFISFQYGELNEKNRLHLSVLQILNKYKIKPLRSPLEGVKELDKDKDKDKEPFGKSENLLSDIALEAAEMNQFTHTGQKNTDFIQSQWEVFLLERKSDPPFKQRQNKNRLGEYFINWVRTKFPKQKVNGKKVSTEDIKKRLEEIGDQKV